MEIFAMRLVRTTITFQLLLLTIYQSVFAYRVLKSITKARTVKIISLKQQKHISSSSFSSSGPTNYHELYKQRKSKAFEIISSVIATSSLSLCFSPAKSLASENDLTSTSSIFIDKINKYCVAIPSSFIIMKNIIPKPAISKYSVEETLLTATNFNEFASLSITKTNVPNLLHDFNIDYWFAPFDSISQIGSPELLSKLLILQRQSDFENKKSVSVVTKSSFSSVNNNSNSNNEVDKNVLYFTFKTPTGNNGNNGGLRYTAAKAYFKNNNVFVLWVSTSQVGVHEENLQSFDSLLNSFLILG